jgi:predicted dithiol-disulfide oxidoreductase (DUF899 family)
MQTKMQERKVSPPKVVSSNEWLAARKDLLAAEKEFTRQRDALSARRRELPWVRVEKNYVFDGPNGKVSLSDLFRDKSQLIIYHFMLGPDWKEGCPSCSYLGDHFDGSLIHLNARDVAFSAISRAPMSQIAAFKKRMGWEFNWVSSNANSFNFDFHVSFASNERVDGKVNYNYNWMEFPSDEAPGLSVFFKNADGEIFHTYSTYGRGLDILLGAYNFLDMTPKGRDEGNLAHTMAWVRHHDRYDNGYTVDASAGYQQPEKNAAPIDSNCCHDKQP